MHEQSKAAKRRFSIGAFHTRYFVGRGIDIGAGPDGLSRYRNVFPGIMSVRDWDLKDGDGMTLPGIEANSFDFVHSSHCLEHLADPGAALRRWIEVLTPGGHCVVSIPDWRLYESELWPSIYGEGHLWRFGMDSFPESQWPEKCICLPALLSSMANIAPIERLELIRDFYESSTKGSDQTMTPNAECCIEFVLMKK